MEGIAGAENSVQSVSLALAWWQVDKARSSGRAEADVQCGRMQLAAAPRCTEGRGLPPPAASGECQAAVSFR